MNADLRSINDAEYVDAEEKKDNNQEDGGNKSVLPGPELCLHNSSVGSWAGVEEGAFIVIGGYPSGVDACVNLVRAGKGYRVLALTPCWNIWTADPLAKLAPCTVAWLHAATTLDFDPRHWMYASLHVVIATVS